MGFKKQAPQHFFAIQIFLRKEGDLCYKAHPETVSSLIYKISTIVYKTCLLSKRSRRYNDAIQSGNVLAFLFVLKNDITFEMAEMLRKSFYMLLTGAC